MALQHIKDKIVDSIQDRAGEIAQSLLRGLEVNSVGTITLTVKSSRGFKLNIIDTKVKGRRADKIISEVDVPIDISVNIDPKLNIKLK